MGRTLQQELERLGGRLVDVVNGRAVPGKTIAKYKKVPLPPSDRRRTAERSSAFHGAHAQATRVIDFQVAPSTDGRVPARRWDLVCLPGKDVRGSDVTEFNEVTLGQMLRNFASTRQGDRIPYDANHSSQTCSQTGQPAPALAWASALALVWKGRVTIACGRGVTDVTGFEPGLDATTDGLYAFRESVTAMGQDLIGGGQYLYLSPTFIPNATTRDGVPVGYCLVSIAFVNTPHQPGTRLG